MDITFTKIKNQSIFMNGFEDLKSINTGKIEFKKQPHTNGGIAVIYAPNGTGKSSLAKTLKSEESTEDIDFEAIANSQTKIVPNSKAFHIIEDQINRNVIPGETSDYLIGENIRREYKLKKQLNEDFRDAFEKNLAVRFKNEYKISKVRDYYLSILKTRNEDAYNFIKDIVNQKSRGKGIDRAKFLDLCNKHKNHNDYVECKDENKAQFIKENANLIKEFRSIDIEKIKMNSDVAIIEQNDDAIPLLKKYHDLDHCVVCDNRDYYPETLLNKKEKTRKNIYNALDKKNKKTLDKVVKNKALTKADPFNIKNCILEFITTGKTREIKKLQEEISNYIYAFLDKMINTLYTVFDDKQTPDLFNEYSQLLESQPSLDSEEILFIEQIISENISRDIRVIRDEENDHNFKLMLDKKPLLNVERELMELSTGEQNFISLAFALLLARHSNREYVIIDDPISSFDSVYKNKIAFCIIKFLENKKQIILTHNTDLIRLLEVQLKDCYNLYILNNTENGKNGFIKVKNDEKNILINLHDLIALFQNKDGILSSIIINKRLFLMSMIPFMRGYAHITNDLNDNYTKLSNLMHGYKHASIDVSKVYQDLFGYRFDEEEVSVDDILTLDFSNLEIIDKNIFPLLADTLVQTLIYYHIRMKVEHDLVEIFSIQIKEGKVMLLTDIIMKAFNSNQSNSDQEKEKLRNYRVFFTSRKTLLNEFNHFEGNMNIFQPAIDIESSALKREVLSITKKLNEIRNNYT